ncbi:unnamed protein product [Choristocarpus tenellus]
MSPPPGWMLVAIPLLPCLALFGSIRDSDIHHQLLASAALAGLGFLSTLLVLPTFTPFLTRRGLTGKDLCKKGTSAAEKIIPEGTGVIAGTVFFVCVVFLQIFFGNSKDKMVDYHSALLSICFMIFLGFTDDVLDLPWRYKLLLPTVATLPLLCAYDGSTTVVLPRPLNSILIGDGGDMTQVLQTLAFFFHVTMPGAGGRGLVLIDLGE